MDPVLIYIAAAHYVIKETAVVLVAAIDLAVAASLVAIVVPVWCSPPVHILIDQDDDRRDAQSIDRSA